VTVQGEYPSHSANFYLETLKRRNAWGDVSEDGMIMSKYIQMKQDLRVFTFLNVVTEILDVVLCATLKRLTTFGRLNMLPSSARAEKGITQYGGLVRNI
jgi:hypothetical protein